ncbi:hypothetical protein ACU4HD_46250 [Cupriavidus basilensis]
MEIYIKQYPYSTRDGDDPAPPDADFARRRQRPLAATIEVPTLAAACASFPLSPKARRPVATFRLRGKGIKGGMRPGLMRVILRPYQHARTPVKLTEAPEGSAQSSSTSPVLREAASRLQPARAVVARRKVKNLLLAKKPRAS